MVEVLALDAQHPQLGGQTVERTGQFHRFGEAQQMTTSETLAGVVELGQVASVHLVHRATRPAAAHGINDPHQARTLPRLHHPRGLAVELHQAHPRVATPPRRQRAEHGPRGTVVTPVRIADTDHRDDRSRHERITLMSRKWVAHEMHGS